MSKRRKRRKKRFLARFVSAGAKRFSRGFRITEMHPKTLVKLGAFIVVALAILIGRGALHSHVNNHNYDRMLNGIYIDDTDVSYMTRNEARAALDDRLNEIQNERVSLSLIRGSYTSVSFREIGIRYNDLESVISEAFEYGREGSLFSRLRTVRASRRGTLTREFTLEYRVSGDELETVLNNRMLSSLNSPVNAKKIYGDDGIEIVEERDGEVFNLDLLIEDINTYLNDEWDRGSTSFSVPVKVVSPDITAAMLAEIPDLLGSFTTYFGDSDANRAQNIENGASKVNHIFMLPGDEIAVGAMMGPYTEENGYAKGTAFAGNIMIESIGGGVCQVSSTLYNAALYAELQILERHAHSLTVSYVPLSRDAAVAEGLLELRIRNDMDTPIYIQAIVEPGLSVTYNIFGNEVRPENRRIEFISAASSGEAPPGTQFVATDQGIGVFYLASDARPPIEAQLIKVVYIDDVEVDRYVVNFSNHLAAPRLMRVGTAHYNPDHTAAILAAISTQSEEYIRATINRILFGDPPPAPDPEPTPEPESPPVEYPIEVEEDPPPPAPDNGDED